MNPTILEIEYCFITVIVLHFLINSHHKEIIGF